MDRLAALLLAITLLAPTAATAQAWTASAQDNGSWFTAWSHAPDRSVSFYCGGPSPGGRPLPQTDEPLMTNAYEMQVIINLPNLPSGGIDSAPRDDINIAAVRQVFALGQMHWDMLSDSGWERSLSFASPLFAELFESSAIAVDAGGTRLATITAPGLSLALGQTIAFCDLQWSRTGLAPPETALPLINSVRTGDFVDDLSTSTPAPTGPTTDALLAAADQYIRRGCNANYTTTPEYLLSGDIDGDGVDDLVVDWNYIQCSAQMTRPFCGASNCSATVFLSRVAALNGTPETLLGVGFSLVPLSNGAQGIASVTNSGICFDTPEACNFLFYWNGAELVDLPK